MYFLGRAQTCQFEIELFMSSPAFEQVYVRVQVHSRTGRATCTRATKQMHACMGVSAWNQFERCMLPGRVANRVPHQK